MIGIHQLCVDVFCDWSNDFNANQTDKFVNIAAHAPADTWNISYIQGIYNIYIIFVKEYLKRTQDGYLVSQYHNKES